MTGLKERIWNRQRLLALLLAVMLVMTSFSTVVSAAQKTEPVTADDPATPELELSVADAVALAMKNNESIKTAALSKENADLGVSISQNSYAQSVLDGPAYSNFGQDATIYGLKAQNLGYEIASLSYDMTKEAVELGVQQLYWNIQLQQSGIEVAKAALAQAEQEYRTMELRKTVGLVTDTAVLNAKASVESARASLTSAEGALQTTIESLKRQIGVKNTTDIVLVEELPEYIPVSIQDLDYYTNKMVLNAPTLKIQELSVDVAEYQEEINKITKVITAMEVGVTYSQQDVERQAEISTETAKEKKKSTEQDLRDKVHSLYYNALTMEANYETVVQNLATVEQTLKNTETMYELGMVTELDLVKARNSYASLQNQYKQLVINHAINSLQLEKPWLATTTRS